VKIIFLAWGKLSRRTRDLCKELGIKPTFIPHGPPYIRSYIETKKMLYRIAPEIVLAQLPQGPLLWTLVRLKDKLNYKLIVDVHSGFLVYDNVKSLILNKPFKRYLSKCDLIIVHNESILELLPNDIKNKSIVVYDPLPKPIKVKYRPQINNYIIVPSSWAYDEPLDYILDEYFRSKSRLKLVITGNYRKRIELFRKYKERPGIIFTGHIHTDKYYMLLSQAKAVIAATTREYTMLSAAWEAIAYCKPLIISYTRTIHSILSDLPEYFKPHVKGSLEAILRKLTPPTLRDLEKRINEASKRLNSIIESQINKLKEYIGMVK